MATEFSNLGKCLRSKSAVLSDRELYAKNKKQKISDEIGIQSIDASDKNELSIEKGNCITTVAELHSTFNIVTNSLETNEFDKEEINNSYDEHNLYQLI